MQFDMKVGQQWWELEEWRVMTRGKIWQSSDVMNLLRTPNPARRKCETLRFVAVNQTCLIKEYEMNRFTHNGENLRVSAFGSDIRGSGFRVLCCDVIAGVMMRLLVGAKCCICNISAWHWLGVEGCVADWLSCGCTSIPRVIWMRECWLEQNNWVCLCNNETKYYKLTTDVALSNIWLESTVCILMFAIPKSTYVCTTWSMNMQSVCKRLFHCNVSSRKVVWHLIQKKKKKKKKAQSTILNAITLITLFDTNTTNPSLFMLARNQTILRRPWPWCALSIYAFLLSLMNSCPTKHAQNTRPLL